jgi:hypothetical protein
LDVQDTPPGKEIGRLRLREIVIILEEDVWGESGIPG